MLPKQGMFFFIKQLVSNLSYCFMCENLINFLRDDTLYIYRSHRVQLHLYMAILLLH